MWSEVAFCACVNINNAIPATTLISDFIDHGDGTVTHTKTGLMWKQCSEGLSGAGCAIGTATFYTWQAALQAAATLNNGGGFAGFTDWRVPNIKELNSIVERQCSLSAANTTVFPATKNTNYWSSSLYAQFGGWSHYDSFSYGVATANSNSNAYLVRLVRGGL